MSNFGAYWLGALVGLIFAVALGATLSVVSPLPGDETVEVAATQPAPTPAPQTTEAEAEATETAAPAAPSEAEATTPASETAATEGDAVAEENPAPAPAASEVTTPIVVAEAEPEAEPNPAPAPTPEAEPEQEAEPAPAPAADPEPEATPEPAAPAINALRDHSERYRGDESQPLLSIVLIDLGDPALNIDEIFLLPAPLTVVIDAASDDPGSLVADARDSGFEALFAVDGGSVQNLDGLLEDAGEIIGLATLNGDVSSATDIAALTDGLTARSMGLFDASNVGGGAIYRAAQAVDLPAAPAGRRIDESPNSEAVYQALERAAFDARRAGAFVVYARPDPAIMTGLRRWMSLKANRSVAVAPLSTVMRKLGRQ